MISDIALMLQKLEKFVRVVEDVEERFEDARATLVRPGRVDRPRRDLARDPRRVVELRRGAGVKVLGHRLVAAGVVKEDVGRVDRAAAAQGGHLALRPRVVEADVLPVAAPRVVDIHVDHHHAAATWVKKGAGVVSIAWRPCGALCCARTAPGARFFALGWA